MHDRLDAVVRNDDRAGGAVPSVPLQQLDEGHALALWDSQCPHPDGLAVLGEDQASGPSRCGQAPAGHLQLWLGDLYLALSHCHEPPATFPQEDGRLGPRHGEPYRQHWPNPG